MASEPVKPYFTRLLRVLTFCLRVSKIVILKENGVVNGVVKRNLELRIFTNWRSRKSIPVPKELFDLDYFLNNDFLVKEVILIFFCFTFI